VAESERVFGRKLLRRQEEHPCVRADSPINIACCSEDALLAVSGDALGYVGSGVVALLSGALSSVAFSFGWRHLLYPCVSCSHGHQAIRIAYGRTPG